MMESEFIERLHHASREKLIELLQELAVRHPILLAEIMSMLEGLPDDAPVVEESDEEVTEDWDFNGEEQMEQMEQIEQVAPRPFPTQPTMLPLDNETHQEHVEEIARRLRQEESPQILLDVMKDLVEDAVSFSGQNDEHAALDLFAILIDERLQERRPAITPLFDQMIDAGMYFLEALLTEASNDTLFDKDTAALSPMLSDHVRHHWLERLFALWLKRLDTYNVEEALPQLILDVAWSEDVLLLRRLVQNELQKQPQTAHANIVDFQYQYRTKALEKFLKELLRT
jgi:hypothetical protein